MRKILAILSVAAACGAAFATPALANQYPRSAPSTAPYSSGYMPGYSTPSYSTPDYSTHDGYRTEGYPRTATGNDRSPPQSTYGAPDSFTAPGEEAAPDMHPGTGNPTYAPYRDADGTCYFYNLTGKLCRD